MNDRIKIIDNEVIIPIGIYGLHLFEFKNSMINNVKDLQTCCKLTEKMVPMEDPGNCPATWGKQVTDNRFFYDDSQIRFIGTGMSQELERNHFRVCLRNRFAQQWPPFHLNWKEKASYLSSCCWHIAILKRPGQIIYPHSSTWNNWKSERIVFTIALVK